MAKFGLDKKVVTQLKADLNVEHVRLDEANDFFFLPQLHVIYEKCGEKLKEALCAKLQSGSYGPQPPIEMEIPKRRRVTSPPGALIGPNYFRPGSVLYPEDRLVYHYLGQVAAELSKAHVQWKRVFSYKPLKTAGAGFEPPGNQWNALKKEFESVIKNGGHAIVLRCDIAQYFFSINQHELVNQLEHQGFIPEIKSFAEKFLGGLTLDRSSRGIIQGCYGSDVLGNSFLSGIDEHIIDCGLVHFRYVDDMYIFFESGDQLKQFFPGFIRKLREYDLSLNEAKTFIAQPTKLLKEETELDIAIERAKEEATLLLTTVEEIEVQVDDGFYGTETITDLLETPPDDEEVELQATRDVFEKLDDFRGDERDRAESFCLSMFRKSLDSLAVPYVLGRWMRHADKAKDYALYLIKFASDDVQRPLLDKAFLDGFDGMLDYQKCWAAAVMRRMNSVSPDLLNKVVALQRDPSQHDVVRSLLTYVVASHATAARKKDLRDGYAKAPLLVQLATIHSSSNFVAAEQGAFLKTASMHGELQALLCDAVK